jgi:hypothetical protein
MIFPSRTQKVRRHHHKLYPAPPIIFTFTILNYVFYHFISKGGEVIPPNLVLGGEDRHVVWIPVRGALGYECIYIIVKRISAYNFLFI